jgi:hypothetical protein
MLIYINAAFVSWWTPDRSLEVHGRRASGRISFERNGRAVRQENVLRKTKRLAVELIDGKLTRMTMSDDLNSQTKRVLTDSQKLDTKLEFDPVLEEGRASALRVSVYVIAGLAIVGLVLYGINSN